MLPLLLALAATGQIRQCATSATYRQSYAAPVQYQQAYAAPYIEKIAFVAVEDAYYSALVGSQVRAELKAKQNLEVGDDLAQRVGQLADAVGRLEARISGAAVPSPGPAPQPPSPDPIPAPPGPATNVPPTPSPDDKTPESIVATFRADCIKCHTAPATGGKKFVMFDQAGNYIEQGPFAKLKIELKTKLGDMPPPPATMAPEKVAQIAAWVANDSDAILAAIAACEKKGSN